jgi:outer membrane biosynthesis protein TonB
MARSNAVGAVPRQSMLAGSVSLVLHGGLVVAALVIAGQRVARSPRAFVLTSIEVFDPSPSPSPSPSPLPPSPPPSPAPPSTPAAVPAAAPVPRREPVPRARAPAAADPRTELKVSYDDPGNFAARAEAATAGTAAALQPAQLDLGAARDLATSLASLQVPAPPRVAVARAPHPRRNYRELRLHDVREFAGQRIKLQLAIDAGGRVLDVKILQGVTGVIDARTLALARSFEFEPALDDTGTPIAGSSRWEILIVDDRDPSYRSALERGHY